MKTIGLALSLVAMLAGAAAARELEDILEEKGVITDTEAMEGKAAKEKKGVELPPLPDWLNKVKFSGDVRVRNEAFFREDDPDRIRQRFRLRFGAKITPTSESELGLRIASGTTSDPISNNQTFTDTFTFKTVAITNAYLKVLPAGTLGFSRSYFTLMGGKFDVPTFHPTRLQFDGDLTPEGFFEAVNLVQSADAPLRALQLNLGQYVFNENSKRGDSALFAFQGLTTFAPTDIVVVNLAVGDFRYQKESTIAAARNKNADLAITNTVDLSDGTRVGGTKIDPAKAGPGKDGKDAQGRPITITRFASDFNVIEAGGDVNVRTPSPRWPVRGFGNWLLNTEATGSEDTGWQFGAAIGPAKDPGDVSFSYAYQRLETDAVVSAFSDSDFGRDGGTNTEGHILQLSYMLPLKGLQLMSTAWITEPIRNVSGRNDHTDYRWQVDLIGKF
jgi:hypothetical protein